MQFSETAAPNTTLPLLGLAFRPFFLFGSLFAIAAIGAWINLLNGWLAFSPYGGPVFWHSHEMVFGFGTAIVAGFLLTAVQNWTGIRGLNGIPLAATFLLWLTARLLMLSSQVSWIVAVIDIAFLPIVGGILTKQIVSVKQWRNLIFIPILLLLTLTNGMMHYSLVNQDFLLVQRLAETAISLMVLMVLVVGSRVIPFFTENALRIPRRKALPYITPIIISTALILATTNLFFGVSTTQGYLALFASLVTGLHIARWFRKQIFSIPLLWSLHISAWFIPIGFMLIGLESLTALVPHHSGLHALTVGAMGGMIIAMMSRVSLGHTGRPLTINKPMATALGIVLLAALIRSISPIVISSQLINYNIPSAMWMIGFSVFIYSYYKPLNLPRLDGRPG